MRKRHEDNQRDHHDNDDHDDHFWVAQKLACDHQCSGDVALRGAECQNPFRVGARSAEQPTSTERYCDKEKSRKDCPCTEDLQNLVNVDCDGQHAHQDEADVGNPVKRRLDPCGQVLVTRLQGKPNAERQHHEQDEGASNLPRVYRHSWGVPGVRRWAGK